MAILARVPKTPVYIYTNIYNIPLIDNITIWSIEMFMQAGKTALMLAAEGGHAHVVNKILDNDQCHFDVDAQDVC